MVKQKLIAIAIIALSLTACARQQVRPAIGNDDIFTYMVKANKAQHAQSNTPTQIINVSEPRNRVRPMTISQAQCDYQQADCNLITGGMY